MFGFGAKLPVSIEDQRWIDAAFVRLEQMLGRNRMVNSTVILPTDDFFPDRYDTSLGSITAIAARIAERMEVPRELFEVELFENGFLKLHEDTTFYGEKTSSDAGGFFFGKNVEGKYTIAINARARKDPLAVGATLAHELAHVLLLGGEILDRNDPDMEPLTDLCTVYLGLGVMNANASFRFSQFTTTGSQGWSTSRSGYLPEPVWGYALAKFAYERGEKKPAWTKYLSPSVASYFSRSAKWLEKQSH